MIKQHKILVRFQDMISDGLIEDNDSLIFQTFMSVKLDAQFIMNNIKEFDIKNITEMIKLLNELKDYLESQETKDESLAL